MAKNVAKIHCNMQKNHINQQPQRVLLFCATVSYNMKLFRLLSTTAVTVLAIAALAISASAMTVDYTAPTETTAGTLTLSDIPVVTGEDDATLLVLNNNVFADFDADETGETTVTITPADIKQINQSDNTADFAEVVIGELADGDKVYVRMQVNGQIYTAEYTKEADAPAYVLGQVTIGDTAIDVSDASLVLQSAAKLVTLTDAQKLAANVTGDTNATTGEPIIDVSDASSILQYAAKLITVFPAAK